MSLRLPSDQLQLQDGNGVGDSRLFDALHGSADLGDLMSRVIDVLIGDFDGRHEASVPAGMTGVTSISLQSLDRGEW